MKATDVLMEEHRVIERMLTVLEQAVERLERGEAVRPGLFADAARFAKGFADGCHHVKEEDVLLKAMQLHRVTRADQLVAYVLDDHERGPAYIRALRSAAERMDGGDETARQDLITNGRGYARLLREHIRREDSELFPLADAGIPTDQHEVVWAGFEHVEHEETGEGVHEAYLRLVEALEAETA
jgi:hemerythrin-like domain-containing protein